MSVNDIVDDDLESEDAHPAARLKSLVHQGSGRLSVLGAILTIWIMDTVLSRHLVASGVVASHVELLDALEWVGTAIFVLTSVTLMVAMTRRYDRLLIPAAAVYLAVAVLQVVVNVISMLSTADTHHGGGLGTLWDVGAVYGMSVIVFMFVYIFLDLTTPGGAFVWPARDGKPAPTPNLFDYMFISMNVNSTYGPTNEAMMSRPGKLLMGLQVLLAVMMLTVLISRAVAATN